MKRTPFVGVGQQVRYDLSIDLVVPLPGFVKRRAEHRILNAVNEMKAVARLERLCLFVGVSCQIDVGGTKCLGVVLSPLVKW